MRTYSNAKYTLNTLIPTAPKQQQQSLQESVDSPNTTKIKLPLQHKTKIKKFEQMIKLRRVDSLTF